MTKILGLGIVFLTYLSKWLSNIELGCCSRPDEGVFCDTKISSVGALVTKYNSILTGNVVLSLRTTGLIACSHKCIKFSWCISINYNFTAERDGDCQLNNAGLPDNELESSASLVEKKGFLFSQLRPKKVGDCINI